MLFSVAATAADHTVITIIIISIILTSIKTIAVAIDHAIISIIAPKAVLAVTGLRIAAGHH